MKLSIIILLNFISGTICLIYGVNLLSNGLEAAGNSKMKQLLSSFTGTTLSGLASGTMLTALVQSSAAVTVITVGLVNSGMLKLQEAVGIIYGANIGTTITAQLMSINMTKLALPILFSGILMKLFFRKGVLKLAAQVICGLGLMFTGIWILHSGVPLIQDSPIFYNIFKNYGTNRYIGLFLGLTTTMLVQSSSATVGLTIVLFNSGLITFEAALGLTLGDNIGTCITAQLSSIGTSISARRTAWAHTLYNVIGVLIVMLLFQPFTQLVIKLTALLGQNEARLIANTHTVFNVLSAFVFLPFTGLYVKLLEFLVQDRNIDSKKCSRHKRSC